MSKKNCEIIISGPPQKNVDKNLSVSHHIFTELIKQDVETVALVEIEKNKKMSYGELIQQCLSLVQGLKAEGVKEGSMVSIASYSSMEARSLALSAIFLGATIAPMDPKLEQDELKRLLEVINPDMLFLEYGEDLRKYEAAVSGLPNNPLIIVPGQKHSHKPFESLLLPADEQFKPPVINDLENHVPLILFTSGSTGLPKGIMLPDYYVLNTLIYKPINLQMTRFVTTPLFWYSGIFSLLGSVVCGTKLLFMNKPVNDKNGFEAIERYKVGAMVTSPKLLIDLLVSVNKSEYDLSSLLFVCCSGANLGADMAIKLHKELFNNRIHVLQMYGMSEVSIVTLASEEFNKPGSTGKVIHGCQCKIVNTETGQSLGPNQPGEICIKKMDMMKGYYMNQKATAAAFDENGWFHTGDLGYFDEDEYLYLLARLSDIINYKSHKIAPSELENILKCHPSVKDVIVVGKPHPVDGEHPVAFVAALKPVSENELLQFLAERVTEEKWLRGGIKFRDSLPYTFTGKPKRRMLIQQILNK